MKNTLFITTILMMSIGAMAQPEGGMDREKIEQLKIAFLTEELDLSKAEAQQFWPAYNEFDAAKEKIEEQIHTEVKTMKKKESRTSKEVSDSIAKVSGLKKQLIDLESSFYNECLPILGAEKTFTLMGADKNFRKKLAERAHERRGPDGQGPRRN